MSEEQNDLLNLCRTIVDKGQFNENDVRQISEYINTFPDLADQWPSNILIGPLQSVWSDGVIDDAELKSLAGLLVSIVYPKEPEPEKPPVIIGSNNSTQSKPSVSLLGDPLAEMISRHKEEQQEALAKVKEAFKALNKRNATTGELEKAEGLISDAAGAVGDLSEQWEDRSQISEFAEEQVEDFCGGEDNDDPSWCDYFEKKPSKGLVRKCAIQARIESKDDADAMGLTIDLIRSELLLK